MKAIVTVKKYDLNGNPYMLAKSEGKRALRVTWDDARSLDWNHQNAMAKRVATWGEGRWPDNLTWHPGGLPDGKSVCWVAVPIPA
jgi:hypothetical protein